MCLKKELYPERSKSVTRSVWAIACLFLLSSVLGGAAFARGIEKQVNREFDVDFGGTFSLDSDLGSVNVTSHAGKQVKVKVLLEADTNNERRAEEWFRDFKLSFNKHGRDVEVNGERDDGLFGRWRQKIKVHFDIVVPDQYNLNVKTAGGFIDVEDITGEVELRTSGGSIKMGQIAGDVIATTSGGSVTLAGADGKADLRSSGGRITVGEVHGDVTAKTSGGGIEVDGVDGDLVAHSSGGGLHLRRVNGNLKASTSGGPITAELLSQIDRGVELRTSGGGIRLDVPDDLKANINASTSGGGVTSDLPVTIRGKHERSTLRGKLNGGGPELFLRTSGGGISIR